MLNDHKFIIPQAKKQVFVPFKPLTISLTLKLKYITFFVVENLMSFAYIPATVPFIPFYYWTYPQFHSLQPITIEKRQQTRETYPDEPQVKAQNLNQSIAVKKTSKNIKTKKLSPRKIRKSKKTKKRDSNFSSKSQKKNRNYISIICKTFLTYMDQHPQLGKLIKPITQRFGISLTAQSFQKILHETFNLKAAYLRKEQVQKVFSSEICSEEFSLIFRILFHKFLKLQAFPAIFKSNKLTKKVKTKEAKFARQVYKTFFQKEGVDKENSLIPQLQESSLQQNKNDLKA